MFIHGVIKHIREFTQIMLEATKIMNGSDIRLDVFQSGLLLFVDKDQLWESLRHLLECEFFLWIVFDESRTVKTLS